MSNGDVIMMILMETDLRKGIYTSGYINSWIQNKIKGLPHPRDHQNEQKQQDEFRHYPPISRNWHLQWYKPPRDVECESIKGECFLLRCVFGRQCHHHPYTLHGGPGGSEHHAHLRRVPATTQRRPASGEVELPAGGDGATRGWAPHRPRQHEEGTLLRQLHQEFPGAQNEADGGEAGEGVWPAHPERVPGGPGPLLVPGARV